jgi:hypothetical protein
VEAIAQIFLSYAREDEEKVKNLYQKLSEAGFKPWMDKKDILPGERWEPVIRKAIQGSDFFLACLSANSVTKRGVLQKEIQDALDIRRGMLDSDIYLIPVRLENSEVPERLRDFQWVNLFEEDGWTRLVEAIWVGMKRRANGEPTWPAPHLIPEMPSPGAETAKPRWRWAALGALLSCLITIPTVIWINSCIETHKQIAEIYRPYEWQWAGENWYGRLTFDERNGRNVITEAKVGLIEKDCATDQIWMDGKVLEMVDESTFDITDSGIEINGSTWIRGVTIRCHRTRPRPASGSCRSYGSQRPG